MIVSQGKAVVKNMFVSGFRPVELFLWHEPTAGNIMQTFFLMYINMFK